MLEQGFHHLGKGEPNHLVSKWMRLGLGLGAFRLCLEAK